MACHSTPSTSQFLILGSVLTVGLPLFPSFMATSVLKATTTSKSNCVSNIYSWGQSNNCKNLTDLRFQCRNLKPGKARNEHLGYFEI
ncbi:hypothetical protein L596_030874 [Steinernema carpocapsae]|uniref:Uncharacterized protein n=1 Tax=Steinernema carpocapsae TaxID=34508 RepID=A0A4U5LNH0_STECR|nr:hypothetical protein L596_030874 [Steinernema carpocapsae]